MQSLIVVWALMQPVDGSIEHCWWGMKTYTTWNTFGYGAKLSVWVSGESHLAIGKNGFLFGQFRIW